MIEQPWTPAEEDPRVIAVLNEQPITESATLAKMRDAEFRHQMVEMLKKREAKNWSDYVRKRQAELDSRQ